MAALLTVAASLPLGCSGQSAADKRHQEGLLLFKHHQYNKAIERFDLALKLQLDRLDTKVLMAEAYLNVDKPQETIKLCEEVLKSAPDRTDALQVLGQAHVALAMDTSKPPEQRKLDETELKAAAAIADQLLKADPNSTEGLLLRARIARLDNKSEEAERIYRQVLQSAGNQPATRLGLVETLLAMGKFAEGEAEARKLVESEKDPNPLAVTHLAYSLAAQNKFDEAYQALSSGISLKKGGNLSHFRLAGRVLLAQIETNRVAQIHTKDGAERQRLQAERKTALDRLVKLGQAMTTQFVNRAESWYYRGCSYQFLGNMKEAIRHLERACSIEPDSKEYLLALAAANAEARDYAGARQQIRRLLVNHPGDYDARLRMAQCYMSEGAAEDATELLRDLRLEFPERKPVKEMLGRALLRSHSQKDVEEGLALLSEVAGPEGLAPGAGEFARAHSLVQQAAAAARDGSAKPGEIDGMLQQAESLFRESIRLEPDNVMSELQLAKLAIRREDLFTALAHARRAARLDPDFRSLEAFLYAQLGQHETAQAIYKELTENDPNAIGFELAEVELESLRDPAAAQKQLEALIDRDPTDPRPALKLGLLLARLDRVKAIEWLREKTGKYPDSIEMRLALARFQIQAAQPKEAIEQLKAIRDIVTKRVEAASAKGDTGAAERARKGLAPIDLDLALASLLVDQDEAAERHALQAVASDPDMASIAAVRQAISLLKRGRADEAARALADIPADEDQSARLSLPMIRSLTQLARGDAAAAAEAVADAKSLNPRTMILYKQLARRLPRENAGPLAANIALQVHLENQPYFGEVVLGLIDQALKVMPEEPFLIARQAETLQSLGRLADADKAFARLRQAAPDFAPALLAHAGLQRELAQWAQARGQAGESKKAWAEAERLVRGYLEKESKDIEALYLLADILQKLDRTDEANTIYEQAIKIDLKHWSAYNNLAWNLGLAQRWDEAAAMAEKALEIRPGQPEVLDTRGWIELNRGNAARAVELLAQASLRLPNNPEVRFHLAQAHERSGDPARAVVELEAIVQAMPGYARIGEVRAMLAKLAPGSGATGPAGESAAPTTPAGAPAKEVSALPKRIG